MSYLKAALWLVLLVCIVFTAFNHRIVLEM